MQERDQGLARSLVFALTCVFFLVALRDAWVGDDIYITLRTVKQLVMRGELGWNPGERVQAYTHPLWMFILAAGYALTKEAYYTTLVISLICQGLAIWVVLNNSKQRLASLLFLTLLISSRAVIDYTTSGLENPLTHLICALTLALHCNPERGVSASKRWPPRARRLLAMSFLTAMAMCNRLDTVLLVAPMAAMTLLTSLREGLKLHHAAGAIVLGALPILAWEAFSLIYYGSFVPNTALAKLNTQIPGNELFLQGLNYLYESLINDHLTLITIFAGLSLPLATKNPRHFAVVAGTLLYTLYLLKIGGDFMSGRFLTGPFFLTAALVTQVRHLSVPQVAGTAAVAILLNLSSPRTTIPLGPAQTPPGRIDHRGIADERGFYDKGAGLKSMNRHNDAPHRGFRYDGEALDPKIVHIRAAMGYVGFHAALDTYLVDRWALTDPLVARLPAIYHPQWRIGHFSRALPGGYIESLQEKKNRFHLRSVGEFYQHLSRIISGPLWSLDRWASIWKLQTGQLDHLIPKPYFRYHGAIGIDATKMEQKAISGNAAFKLGDTGIFIDFHKTVHDKLIALYLDADDDYLLLYEKKGKIIGRRKVPRVVPRPKTPQLRLIEVQEDIVSKGYQAIRVLPRTGHAPFQIWHMHTANNMKEHEAKLAALKVNALPKPGPETTEQVPPKAPIAPAAKQLK